MEATVTMIVMMMKPNMVMELRVKVKFKLIPKTEYIMVGLNKWCAL